MTTSEIAKRHEIFEKAIKNAMTTERVQHFRLCVDEKDNISIAIDSTMHSKLSGTFVPTCPTNTKEILDIVITPTIQKYKLGYLE